MSAPSLNGGDAAKQSNAASSASGAAKHQLRPTNSGKALDGARKQAASPVDGQPKKQQPKAWQEPNPITQRASNSNVPNGNEKPLPKLPQQNQQRQNTTDLQADKHAHDRSAFFMAQFIGKDVTISLKNGEQFTGVYSGGPLEAGKTQYVIKMARRKRLPAHQQVNGNSEQPFEYMGQGEDHVMSFDVQDTADFFVEDVSFAATASQQNGSIGSSFLTDTQISSRETQRHRERELQRWEPGPETSVDMSLGDPSETGWDQFAVNESMYGVQSSYDEDIYTTTINRNDPEYRRREAEAERIAREIEGSSAASAHVAEERRRDAHRDDIGDEEAKYSGVARDLPQRAKNSYVPPNQRPQAFDPAIISVTKPASSSAQPSNAAAIPTAASAASAETSAPKAPIPEANAATPKKKENTTEDRVRDTADAFKHFANTEKLRIRAAQEAKRTSARQEKNVKLNDLKKFAANFKLKSRVPDDLVPILAKDPAKQNEIQHRAEEAAKLEEVRAKEKSDKGSTVASPAPAAVTAQAGPSGAGDPRMPFNSNQLRNGAQRPQQVRNNAPLSPTHPGAPRQPFNARHPFVGGRPGMPQPLPADLRIPTAAPVIPAADLPMSPNSITRLNVNAKSFEFRPGASAFTPTGTSPSPQRSTNSGMGPSPVEATTSFFKKDGKKEGKSTASDSLQRMADTEFNETEKKKYTPNGGLPQAYNTLPTWSYPKANDSVSHTAAFPKVQAPSQGPSPLQTPNPNGPMPHAHQLPPHMQGHPMSTPAQRPAHFYPQQPHGPQFDPRFQQQFGPNGSVQNSPRPPHGMPAPFNAQMAPFPPQGMPGQPMPGYGASPSMQIRQPNMPPQGMMMPGQQGHMVPMPPNFQPGPHFRPQQQMGGHMMVSQPSGGYPGGPVPHGYSPMPPHNQPNMQHMQPNGPAGYSGSPRPPMMQHQGSHQGYQQQMQPHFMPSPGQPHPYHMQQRAMSGGLPQMTPRQQHSVPNHGSPGMVPAQGDEGK